MNVCHIRITKAANKSSTGSEISSGPPQLNEFCFTTIGQSFAYFPFSFLFSVSFFPELDCEDVSEEIKRM